MLSYRESEKKTRLQRAAFSVKAWSNSKQAIPPAFEQMKSAFSADGFLFSRFK